MVNSIISNPVCNPVWNPVSNAAGSGDLDVNSYASRVAANGGTISPSALAEVSKFILGTKADGTWSKLYDVGLFVGVGNRQAANVKIKAFPGSPSTFVSNGFVDADFTSTGASAGLKGDTTGTKYLECGWFIPNLVIGDNHLGIYNTVVNDGNRAPCGAVIAGSSAYFFMRSSQADVGPDGSDISLGRTAGGNNGFRTGYTFGSNQGGSLYGNINNSQIFTSATSGIMPADVMILFNVKVSGVIAAAQAYNGTLSFYHSGLGLTPAESISLGVRVNTLMTAFGANKY